MAMPSLFLLIGLLAIPGLEDPKQQKITYPPAEEVRKAFHRLLDRPGVPLNTKTSIRRTSEGLVTEVSSFASEKKSNGVEERVPVLIVRPERMTGRLPAVIVLHGTGGTKEGERGLLADLARKGFVAVAIDARYHGERSGNAKGAEAYVAAITRAWKTPPGQPMEHPFYYDTCWDLWKTVDYLQSREDVDPERIGMIGFSMGGIQTWLAATVDERVKVLVPAIAVQSFRWSLDNNRWHARANTIFKAHEEAAKDLGEAKVNQKVCLELWNKVIPGMLGQFDCPSMVRLAAGRPMLILSGELDPNCPLEGARLAIRSAQKAYQEAGSADKLKVMIAEGVPHQVTAEQREAAIAWFEKHLK